MKETTNEHIQDETIDSMEDSIEDSMEDSMQDTIDDTVDNTVDTMENEMEEFYTDSEELEDEKTIFDLTEDCFTNIFSYLGLKYLALLSMVSKDMQELVFSCTREIRTEKVFASMNFLTHFSHLTVLEIFGVKSGYNDVATNVIGKQQYLRVLHINRVDDRDSVDLKLNDMHCLESLTVDWAKFMHNVELSPLAVEKTLKSLKIHNTAFSDFYFNNYPKKFGVAPKLKFLDLSYCQNIVLPNINSFAPNVTHIDISRTSIINQTIYAIIENCKSLKTLICDYCETVGNGHLIIKDHKKLEFFSMRLCRYLYNLTISGCTALKKIDVSRAGLTNESLCQLFHDNAFVEEINISESFKAFENSNFTLKGKQAHSPPSEESFIPLQTKRLDLSLTLLNSRFFEEFIQAGSLYLEELNVNTTQISTLTLSAHVTLPRLICLDVSTTNISNRALESLLQISPALENLIAKRCERLTPSVIIASESLKRLELNATPCTNDTIQELCHRCPNLEWLAIQNDIEKVEITSSSLRYCSISGCTTLQEFTLGYCPKLEHISAQNLVSLTRFNVGPNGELTPVKRVELKQSPQLIGRRFQKYFPNAKLEGFMFKNEIFDREDPTIDELRKSYYAYQNLHSTHILVSLVDKINQMLETADSSNETALKHLRANIQLQLGHYRSIQGRDIQEGIQMTKESLAYYQSKLDSQAPELYFRIKFAYETLLALYKHVPGADIMVEDSQIKLDNWIQSNKLDTE